MLPLLPFQAERSLFQMWSTDIPLTPLSSVSVRLSINFLFRFTFISSFTFTFAPHLSSFIHIFIPSSLTNILKPSIHNISTPSGFLITSRTFPSPLSLYNPSSSRFHNIISIHIASLFCRSGSRTRFYLRSGSPACIFAYRSWPSCLAAHYRSSFVITDEVFVCIFAVTVLPARVLTAIKNLELIPYCNLTVAGRPVKHPCQENGALGNLLGLAEAPLDRSGEKNVTFVEFMAVAPVAVCLTRETHGTQGDRSRHPPPNDLHPQWPTQLGNRAHLRHSCSREGCGQQSHTLMKLFSNRFPLKWYTQGTQVSIRPTDSTLDMSNSFEACVWAATCCSFWGMVCFGEVSIKSHTAFNGNLHLKRSDVHFDADLYDKRYVRLDFPSAKTAHPGEIQTIHLVEQAVPLSPLIALENLAKVVPASGSDPLFSWRDKHSDIRPFVKDIAIAHINPILSAWDFSNTFGHSFRIGGASFFL